MILELLKALISLTMISEPLMAGTPQSSDSENHDWNATPGPSWPYNGRHGNDDHDHDYDCNNNCTNMTTHDMRQQGNDPDDLDDSSSSDGTYKQSHSSWDKTSNSYPSFRTEDRHQCPHQSRNSNQTWSNNHRCNHGQCAHDCGHRGPSDSLSLSSGRGRQSERQRSQDDQRSFQHHSTQMHRSTRERSIPSQTPSYNEWHHEDDTCEDQYEAELLHYYERLIHDHVGHEHKALPDITNIRVSSPEKYSGKDNIKVFDTCLNVLLCWFWVYNVTGGHKDCMRVWNYPYWSHCNMICRWSWGLESKTRKWYFKDLICNMYKRFIHEVTTQNTANSYARTKFSHSNKALVFYNELQCHVSRMVQPPDKYSMKRKFLKRLAKHLIKNLLKSRWVSVEHTSLATLLHEVNCCKLSKIIKAIK